MDVEGVDHEVGTELDWIENGLINCEGDLETIAEDGDSECLETRSVRSVIEREFWESVPR